jgi:tryptophanyl-tRNA synthetase
MFRVEKRRDKNQNTYISIREKKANKEALREIGRRIECSKKIYAMHMDVYEIEESEMEREMNKIEEIVREVEIEFGGYGFFLPASTYHRFMHGLTGGKMSSSNPESYISLTEPPREASEKVKSAKTGGRATIEEQRNLGGFPEECTVYELMMFHLIEDDTYIMEIFEECKNGKRSCNSCKKLASELMFSFIKKHQEERENAKEVLKEHGIGKRWIKEN